MPSKVWNPGELGYERVLHDLFNGDAAAMEPSRIIQPRNEEDVASAVERARSEGLQLRVRSGGHSRFCSGDGVLMLDLAAHFRAVSLHADLVTIQGGTSMGEVLRCLAPYGRMIPVGTHDSPGFGLLTMGGLGHLCRSFGLTLDNIVALRGVDGTGQQFCLNETDQQSAAWRYLRGAAPFLAVVTEVTLRTHPRNPLRVNRQLLSLVDLPQALTDAETMPRHISCSFVLGVQPDQVQPVVMRYEVMEHQHWKQQAELSQLEALEWQEQVAGLEDLPGFSIPNCNGTLPPEIPPDPDRHRRLRSWIYTVSISPGQISVLAPLLQSAICKAPNPLCRIDLQHSGGAVRQPLMGRNAYRGREAEWSIVVSSFWAAGDGSAERASRIWADGVFDALEAIACHVYLVERHPGTCRYSRELELAYGSDLSAIRELKRQWDPDSILPSL